MLTFLPSKLKQFLQREWLTIIYTTIGTIIISFALVALIMPYRFASAGLTGIALISHYALNISQQVDHCHREYCFIALGLESSVPRFVIWTFYVSILMTVSVMFFELFTYPLIQNVFLAAILGGVLGGLGMGLIFLGGGSSGEQILLLWRREKIWY